MTAKNPTCIRIFDTTLRDGEQTPGVSLTFDDKIEIARQLSLLARPCLLKAKKKSSKKSPKQD